MTTKEQERKALEQIRKIVNGLGEDSYIATAFDGAFDIAEANIRDDFANSVNDMLDSRDQKIERLQAECRKLEEELANLANQKKVMEKNNAAEINYLKAHELSFDVKRRIYGMLQEEVEKDSKTMIECADDMAFFDPSDIAFTSAVEAYKRARNHKIDCEVALQAIDKSING